MQVISRLVKMEFTVGAIERAGDQLIIHSDPKQVVQAKVHMSPADVVGLIRAGLNWSVVAYVLSFPFIYWRTQKAKDKSA